MSALKNIPPFYVGQNVVCVKGSEEFKIKKGVTYTVTEVVSCKCSTRVSVGIKGDMVAQPPFQGTCATCKGKLIFNRNETYAYSTRFAPTQQKDFPLLTFSKIQKKEKQKELIDEPQILLP